MDVRPPPARLVYMPTSITSRAVATMSIGTAKEKLPSNSGPIRRSSTTTEQVARPRPVIAWLRATQKTPTTQVMPKM